MDVNEPPVFTGNFVFEVEENLPVGTTIAQFSALDVDAGNTLTFEWAELAEDNPWFFLEADGQLRTREVLDYEKNASHEISIRVVDQDGASSVQDFEIRVRDVFRPIVRTVHRNWEDEVVLTGNVLETGGESMLFERGFVLGQNPDPVTTDSDVEVFLAPGQAGIYEYFLPMNSEFNNWYYRAYAKNGEGISYGSSHRLTMPMHDIMNAWLNAFPMEGMSGWWNSPWFGEFYMTNDSGWIMHAKLGWVFSMGHDDGNGVWLWQNNLGWLWTKDGVYPYIFQHTLMDWLFFHGNSNNQILFYNYQETNWLLIGR